MDIVHMLAIGIPHQTEWEGGVSKVRGEGGSAVRTGVLRVVGASKLVWKPKAACVWGCAAVGNGIYRIK